MSEKSSEQPRHELQSPAHAEAVKREYFTRIVDAAYKASESTSDRTSRYFFVKPTLNGLPDIKWRTTEDPDRFVSVLTGNDEQHAFDTRPHLQPFTVGHTLGELTDYLPSATDYPEITDRFAAWLRSPESRQPGDALTTRDSKESSTSALLKGLLRRSQQEPPEQQAQFLDRTIPLILEAIQGDTPHAEALHNAMGATLVHSLQPVRKRHSPERFSKTTAVVAAGTLSRMDALPISVVEIAIARTDVPLLPEIVEILHHSLVGEGFSPRLLESIEPDATRLAVQYIDRVLKSYKNDKQRDQTVITTLLTRLKSGGSISLQQTMKYAATVRSARTDQRAPFSLPGDALLSLFAHSRSSDSRTAAEQLAIDVMHGGIVDMLYVASGTMESRLAAHAGPQNLGLIATNKQVAAPAGKTAKDRPSTESNARKVYAYVRRRGAAAAAARQKRGDPKVAPSRYDIKKPGGGLAS